LLSDTSFYHELSVHRNLLKPDAPRSVWVKSGGWVSALRSIDYLFRFDLWELLHYTALTIDANSGSDMERYLKQRVGENP
jgi:hypothetical protein